MLKVTSHWEVLCFFMLKIIYWTCFLAATRGITKHQQKRYNNVFPYTTRLYIYYLC